MHREHDLLDAIPGDFEVDAPFLHLLLGLIAADHHLDRHLCEAARAPAATERGHARSTHDEHPVLDLLLGLIAAREALRRVLPPLAPSPPESGAPPPTAPAPAPFGLLR